MRLIGKWRVLIEGDDRVLGIFPWRRKGLEYLLGRLFSGDEVAPSALEHYDLAVRELGERDEVITVPDGSGTDT